MILHATLPSATKIVIGAVVAAFLTGIASDASASAFEIKLLKSTGAGGGGGSSSGSGGGAAGSGGGSSSLGIGGGSFGGGGGVAGAGGARGIIAEAKSAVTPQAFEPLLDDVVALDVGDSEALIVSGPAAAAIAAALNGTSTGDTNTTGSVVNPVNGLAAPPISGPPVSGSPGSGNYSLDSSVGDTAGNELPPSGDSTNLAGNEVLPNAAGSEILPSASDLFDSSAIPALVAAIAPDPSGFVDSSPSASAEVIPASEPGALFLLGAGLILAARRAGRRRST
jgi:hypothetical protein